MNLNISIITILLLALQVACTSGKEHLPSTNAPSNYIDDSTTIKNNQLCNLVNENVFRIKILPINEFKDSLTITLDCVRSHFGVETCDDSISYVEKFKEESSIIRLSEKVGLRVCVGRVVMNGDRYYIYTTHLYANIGNCWKDMKENNGWEKFNLGGISGGMSFGNDGSPKSIGFEGELRIE